MKLSMIVAVGPNGEIGYKGKLPWPRLREDMRWFRRHTAGKPVIMGRRTWESLPASYRPLPGRGNFILSRNLDWYPDYYTEDPDTSVDTYQDLDDVLDYLEIEWGGDEAVIIGGAALYQEAMPRAEVIYLTRVLPDGDDFVADTFFPYPLPPDEWQEHMVRGHFFMDHMTGISTGFYTLTRRGQP